MLFWLLVITGCGTTYTYRDVSEFDLHPGMLTEGAAVRIIYTSRSPDARVGKDYYVHLVVVEIATGDTVNVLTTMDNGFSQKDADKPFYYLEPDSWATKVMLVEDLQTGELHDQLAQASWPDLKHVASDPRHDRIARNVHPTVFGLIAHQFNAPEPALMEN